MDIDIKLIAKEMVKNGFTKDSIEEGGIHSHSFHLWDSLLVCALDDKYGLTKKLYKEITRRNENE